LHQVMKTIPGLSGLLGYTRGKTTP
jgi:hypothetical protein